MQEEAEQVARTRRLWAGGEHQQHQPTHQHTQPFSPSILLTTPPLHSSLPIRRSGVVTSSGYSGTTAGWREREAPTRSGWGQYAPPMAGSQTSMTEAALARALQDEITREVQRLSALETPAAAAAAAAAASCWYPDARRSHGPHLHALRPLSGSGGSPRPLVSSK